MLGVYPRTLMGASSGPESLNGQTVLGRAVGVYAASSFIAVLLVLPGLSGAGEAVGGNDKAMAESGRVRNSSEFIPDVFPFDDCGRPQIDLNGAWEFRRDPLNQGVENGWHEGRGLFVDTMEVPGVPQAQGYGEPHRYQRTAFKEPFWMRRTFNVPALEPSNRVWLRVGGILPAAEVYVNGSHIGYTKSSRTQQRVDVTESVNPGAGNLVAIKVCDFPDMRLDGLLEWNEGTQLWTGPYRPITCEIAHRVSVIDAYVRPDLAAGSVHVNVEFSESLPEQLLFLLKVVPWPQNVAELGTYQRLIPSGAKRVKAEVKLANFTPWSPAHPQLYALQMSLMKSEDTAPVDTVSLRFGMREFAAEGTKFYLNGSPVFLCVYGEDHYYPETLAPPADKGWYLPRLKLARECGFNATKGCVETIPQEYIEAADEAGIMIIQEMPFGLSWLRANRYTIDEPFREYYSRELDGLVRVSRNHASVVAYSMSSEMEFSQQTQASFDFFSRDLVQQTRNLAPHALVIDCTGYLHREDTEKGKRDTDFYASIHPKWMKEVLDEADMLTDSRHPTILHEYNWWSCYPDPGDRAKYAAAQLKPFWLDILEETARENGQEELIPVYRKNSLRLQALCRKDGIEYARRNPTVEGYILWLLVDFGPWSEGLLDDFWNLKNVTAEEFLKSNGDTVVLLAQEGNRCLDMSSRARIPLAVSHYGEVPHADAKLHWRAQGKGFLEEGAIDIPDLEPGELTQAGCAEFDVPNADTAYKFELQVSLHHAGKTLNTNNWSFWAFPEVGEEVRTVGLPDSAGAITKSGLFPRLGSAGSEPIEDGVSLVIADGVDEALTEYIDKGGRCVLLVTRDNIENSSLFPGTTNNYGIFRTIPWNAGTSGNSGTVIGDHPAMGAFPHEGMCDLPFVRMVKGCLPMEFSGLRKYGVEPIIRNIDHYRANRNLAYLLEFRIGKGKAVVTSLGMVKSANEHLEARYFLSCLIDYARGTRFEPEAMVPQDAFLRLFKPKAVSQTEPTDTGEEMAVEN